MGIKSESEQERKAKQVAYHDWEATTYDEKFSISYDERCIEYARARFDKVIAAPVEGKVLEVGAGTGFFLINLALGKAIRGELHATDISEGMLSVCKRNAEEHGLELETRQGDAESLPYDDDTFDLVIGHAFIHHLPVPGKALQEVFRVLKPGGRVLIAGEPTELGDRISQVIKRTTYRAFTVATKLPRLRELRKPTLEEMDDHDEATLAGLEHEVDLHTFRPKDVEHMARLAGFDEVRVVTEELTANWVGWAVRTIEGSVQPGALGVRWAFAAFNAYRWLSRLDDEVFARFVPRELFYNLILHGRKPTDP